MKYYIGANQVGVVRAGLHTKTDIIDWCIIDYIKDWFFSDKAKKARLNEEEYVWINFTHLLESMPLLSERDHETKKIKKIDRNRLSERLLRLKSIGLLKLWKAPENTIYIRLTDLSISVCDYSETRNVTEHHCTETVPALHGNSASPLHENSASTSSISLQEEYHINIPSKKQKSLPNNETIQSFNEFYKQYPRKIGRQSAFKAWIKLKPTTELISEITSSLVKQKESEQWVKDGGKFIPHPATWLNGRRWEDEIHQEKKWNEA